MIKLFLAAVMVAIIAATGFALYKGFIGDNDNAKTVATKTGELAASITETFTDGVKDIAKDVKDKAFETADSAKAAGDRAVDSAKSEVKARVDEVAKEGKARAAAAKDAIVNGVKDTTGK